jgi:hypothetical protein
MAWSDIFIPDGKISSSEQADVYAHQQQQFQEALSRRQAEGSLSNDQVNFYVSNTDGLQSQNDAAAAGLAEGAQEGLNNVLDAPGKIVGIAGKGLTQVLGGVLMGIPVWLYLVAGIALFVWMGGMSLLRGRLSKA